MMKKSVCVLLTVIITLSLILSSGCGTKAETSPPEDTAEASQPATASASQGTKPSVKPAPDDTTVPEPSDEETAEPSAEKPLESAPAELSPTPEPDDGKDYAMIGFELLESEGLDNIMLRLSESELIYLLGEPVGKSEAEIWGADGLEHSNWGYASIGLDIGMAKLPDDTEAYVYSISATAPCELTTERGIGIGSSKDAVLEAYKNEIDPDANDATDSWITIGSVYGGIGIGIEDGAVTYIYIGASAE